MTFNTNRLFKVLRGLPGSIVGLHNMTAITKTGVCAVKIDPYASKNAEKDKCTNP
jgi:hypothetical protein